MGLVGSWLIDIDSAGAGKTQEIRKSGGKGNKEVAR